MLITSSILPHFKETVIFKANETIVDLIQQ